MSAVVSAWDGRSVLVTGADGFIGSWLVERLLDEGTRVVVPRRDSAPESRFRADGIEAQCHVVLADILERESMVRILNEENVDTVFHLAAQAIVGVANRSPLSTWESNVRGTYTLLEACREVTAEPVQRVVVASSDKAYGDHEQLPYDENAPLQGRHPYDVSKSCADLIAQMYAATYGLPVAVTRCGNFYGGGDLNWNRLVPGTIRALLRGDRPVIRSDGSYIRDYFYVEDGAAANMLLAEQLASRAELRGEAFNFSNELQVSVLELVRRVSEIVGSDLQPDVRNEAQHEIHHQYLSAEKARRLLGWSPLFTLDEGLRSTAQWYRTFLGAEGGGGR